MYYFTIKQSPAYEQMSLEEFLFGDNPRVRCINDGETNTRTYCVERISSRIADFRELYAMYCQLKRFVEKHKSIIEADKTHMYSEFPIPKKTGGFRKINAPNDELKQVQDELKDLFERDFGCLYHTSAHAYISGRSTITCMKRHQENNSKWFLKLDLKNFFGSTTEEFVMSVFKKTFPMCKMMEAFNCEELMRKAISVAFLNGTLPQGTPVSPTITNIMMIPIDYHIANNLRDFNGQRYIYTRYADDFQISSRYGFMFKDVIHMIESVLVDFNAPFRINHEKTRYASSNGSNWNLGLMLNKDNGLTVGYKRKRAFRSAMVSFVKDFQGGVRWDYYDLKTLDGLKNYYLMVEKDEIKKIFSDINDKFGVDCVKMLKHALRAW